MPATCGSSTMLKQLQKVREARFKLLDLCVRPGLNLFNPFPRFAHSNPRVLHLGTVWGFKEVLTLGPGGFRLVPLVWPRVAYLSWVLD